MKLFFGSPSADWRHPIAAGAAAVRASTPPPVRGQDLPWRVYILKFFYMCFYVFIYGYNPPTLVIWQFVTGINMLGWVYF